MRAGSVLFELPGLRVGEIAVRLGDGVEDGADVEVDEEALHVPARLAQERVGAREHRQIFRRRRGFTRVGYAALAVLRDHGERALCQIADIVGEIGVEAAYDRFVRIAAVLPERDLAQEKIADRVKAVGRDETGRAHDIADRLRHLLAAVEQEAVHDDLSRQGELC